MKYEFHYGEDAIIDGVFLCYFCYYLYSCEN
jgi:hypothetical protein